MILEKNIILGFVLVVLFLIEYFGGRQRIVHSLNNIGIGLLNIIIVSFIPLFFVDEFFLEVPWVLEILITILILDLITYFLHRAHHTVPFLWRFHKMHHSDTAMNVTTAVRFHIGELFVSLFFKGLAYYVFGMQLEAIIIYETLFIANVYFQHADISIGKFDKFFRIFFTSPDMHKVHHSNRREETDSNYTSLFSFWDRIFGSYRRKKEKITFGIKGLEKEQSFIKMLLTPLKKS